MAPAAHRNMPKPPLTAPKWEKELYRALAAGAHDDIRAIAERTPEQRPFIAALDGLLMYMAGDYARARQLLEYARDKDVAIEIHPFVRKYGSQSTVTLGIADGVTATMPLTRDAVRLALAELQQADGDIGAAIKTVEAAAPSAVTAVSLAELYVQAKRWEDVVELTDGVRNDSNETALLLTFRGVALREQGHYTAAREALKSALASRSREEAIRHRALVERAAVSSAEGKMAQARKDLEKVLAEDSSYPGLREALAALPAT
jgi:tetratricopeptide (TPR) repeat protein